MRQIENERVRLFGLLVRKERWGISWMGRVVIFWIVTASAALFVFCIQPFLAVTEPVAGTMLVVEGWIPPAAVARAAGEFRTGRYNFLVTTGGPFTRDRGQPGNSNNWAETGAYWLRKAGVDAALIHPVASSVADRDRTYHSALALRAWLMANAPEVRAINVFTEGAHARRTRLLFEKALGPNFRVGIIAAQNPEYDPAHWWRTSEGFREVISESVAYLYARVVFRP